MKAYLLRIFCSKKCYTLSMIGKSHNHKTSNGHIPWNKGKKCLPITGEKNGIWMGDKVSYRALHSWVERKLGKPCQCEFCGKKDKGKQMHWANINHNYKRIITDWIRLCASCHKTYDRNQLGLSFQPHLINV